MNGKYDYTTWLHCKNEDCPYYLKGKYSRKSDDAALLRTNLLLHLCPGARTHASIITCKMYNKATYGRDTGIVSQVP